MSNEKAASGQPPEQESAPVLPMKMDVTARLIEPKGNLVGFASLKINNSFMIDDFKILQRDKCIFVGMQSKADRKCKTGYRDPPGSLPRNFARS